MERHYDDSHILFLESRAQSIPLQICISLFTIRSGSNTCDLVRFYEKSHHSRYLNS